MKIPLTSVSAPADPAALLTKVLHIVVLLLAVTVHGVLEQVRPLAALDAREGELGAGVQTERLRV